LRPYLCRIEQEISKKILTKQNNKGNTLFVQFDTKEMLRGDFQSQMMGYAVGRQWQILTANECRTDYGLSPMEGQNADDLWRPVNMVPSRLEPSEQKIPTDGSNDPKFVDPQPGV
jgi:hypothetical protein